MNTARPLLEFLQCCSVASHTWEMAILKDFQLLLIKLIIILPSTWRFLACWGKGSPGQACRSCDCRARTRPCLRTWLWYIISFLIHREMFCYSDFVWPLISRNNNLMTSPLLRLSVYPVPHVMYLTQAKEPMVLSHLLVYKNGVVNYRICHSRFNWI